MKSSIKSIMAAFVFITFTSNAYAENTLLENSSIGLGFGIPYGLFGINASYKLNDTFDLTAGAGVGFGAGIRYRPFEKHNSIRFTAFYGTNAELSNLTTNKTEHYSGLNIGIGHGEVLEGFDTDLLYAFTSKPFKNRVKKMKAQGYTFTSDTNNKVVLSFGYHW